MSSLIQSDSFRVPPYASPNCNYLTSGEVFHYQYKRALHLSAEGSSSDSISSPSQSDTSGEVGENRADQSGQLGAQSFIRSPLRESSRASGHSIFHQDASNRSIQRENISVNLFQNLVLLPHSTNVNLSPCLSDVNVDQKIEKEGSLRGEQDYSNFSSSEDKDSRSHTEDETNDSQTLHEKGTSSLLEQNVAEHQPDDLEESQRKNLDLKDNRADDQEESSLVEKKIEKDGFCRCIIQ